MSAIEQQDSHRPPSDGGMAKEEFIRVGTTLYKIVEQPRLNGGYVKKRIAWNNETLRQDYGKDYIGSVPKYDGFCTVPEHIGYRSVVGKFLNLYEPIDHRPQEGDLSHIQSLVRHIFGEQYELGMDYLQLLYLQPIQKLPILLLVSEERNLVTVFAFGFHLIGKCGAEVLQPLAILPAVEQHLIHHDKELASPVGIELAAEILVGVESHIVLKKGFQKVQEGAFARVAFFRHQQQDRQLLNWLQVEQLQIVHPQLVLFPEDVPYQRLDMR